MTEERLIKKYANRRLYDASQSRHITLLDDIRTLIIGGEKIKVVDDRQARTSRGTSCCRSSRTR